MNTSDGIHKEWELIESVTQTRDRTSVCGRTANGVSDNRIIWRLICWNIREKNHSFVRKASIGSNRDNPWNLISIERIKVNIHFVEILILLVTSKANQILYIFKNFVDINWHLFFWTFVWMKKSLNLLN